MAIFKAAVEQTQNLETMYNVLGFVFDSDDLTLLQSATDIIANAYQTHMVPTFTDNWTFEAVNWYDQEAPFGTPGIRLVPTGGTFTGGSAVDPMPRNVAGLLSLTCSFGPPHRGRVYFVGFHEGVNGPTGQPEATAITAMEDWATQLRTDIIGLGGNNRWQVVRQRTTDTVPPETGLVTNWTGRSRWHTQRRRNNGV